MSRSIQDTMDEIIAFMWWNQNKKLDGEKENYVSNIARELNMTRPRVMRSLEWLENNISFVTSWKEGNRVCYRLRHDPYANINNDSSQIAKENLSINPESLEDQKED
jgi:hypothetical protein